MPLATRVELGGDTAITVKSIAAGGDDGGPWLAVAVKLENTASADGTGPDIGLWCNGQSYTPINYQANSTLSLPTQLPARSFRNGTLYLLAPGDSRTGSAVPACTGPAYIRAQTADAGPPAQYPVPATALTYLNAHRNTGS